MKRSLNKKDALLEFDDWKEYVLKYMEIRGNQGDFIHLSNSLTV